jgi:hypothetical protein
MRDQTMACGLIICGNWVPKRFHYMFFVSRPSCLKDSPVAWYSANYIVSPRGLSGTCVDSLYSGPRNNQGPGAKPDTLSIPSNFNSQASLKGIEETRADAVPSRFWTASVVRIGNADRQSLDVEVHYVDTRSLADHTTATTLSQPANGITQHTHKDCIPLSLHATPPAPPIPLLPPSIQSRGVEKCEDAKGVEEENAMSSMCEYKAEEGL